MPVSSAQEDFQAACLTAASYVDHWKQQAENTRALTWLLASAATEVVEVLVAAQSQASPQRADSTDGFEHHYEQHLAAHDRRKQKRHGVFFTPREIAGYVVRRIDRALVEEFDIVGGLADSSLPLLDPAVGSGIFLAEVIRHVRKRLASLDTEQWSRYVVEHLLPRLHGWDILLPAVVAAHLHLVETLLGTGFDFRHPAALHLSRRDALDPTSNATSFPIVLGNPPYASLSTSRHGWIESLISSSDGYTTVDGEPLAERKHWLHDDYVKFVRLAQWHVEQAGAGIVGFVTNHGFLENASFRGMRCSLINTFSRLEVIDLHGNGKRREKTPSGERDENVFANVASGAAITIMRRPPSSCSTTLIEHRDAWGSREVKLRELETDDATFTRFTPQSPSYWFHPRVVARSIRYDEGFRLVDAMPINTTAPVTARDGFTVAFTREELCERIALFCDRSISDDVLRERYFHTTRSSKYPPGDTRGWKLATARERLREEKNPESFIRRVQYRPMDYRCVLWHPALVDWPRREVMRHLLEATNVALVARRQSPTNEPAAYFWATSELALDGIVRSDNRGGESLFPLRVFDEDGMLRPNFSPMFLTAMEQAVGARCDTDELAGYIYGQFFSLDYRRRFHDSLATDFPRITLPRSQEQFQSVSAIGRELLRRHTQPTLLDEGGDDAVGNSLAHGYPKFDGGRIALSASSSIEATEDVWDFRVGSHQIARKWLRERRTRALSQEEMKSYRNVLATIDFTLQKQRELESLGTWEC